MNDMSAVYRRRKKPRRSLQFAHFNGAILQRGFWLYVWEVTTKRDEMLYYVGRTGDNSSTKAQAPYTRMGQHLGRAPNTNALLQYLVKRKVDPRRCGYRLIAFGPLDSESESTTRQEHDERRDRIAPMEKALADFLKTRGLDIMNNVHCRKVLDKRRFAKVRSAFERALLQAT